MKPPFQPAIVLPLDPPPVLDTTIEHIRYSVRRARAPGSPLAVLVLRCGAYDVLPLVSRIVDGTPITFAPDELSRSEHRLIESRRFRIAARVLGYHFRRIPLHPRIGPTAFVMPIVVLRNHAHVRSLAPAVRDILGVPLDVSGMSARRAHPVRR